MTFSCGSRLIIEQQISAQAACLCCNKQTARHLGWKHLFALRGADGAACLLINKRSRRTLHLQCKAGVTSGISSTHKWKHRWGHAAARKQPFNLWMGPQDRVQSLLMGRRRRKWGEVESADACVSSRMPQMSAQMMPPPHGSMTNRGQRFQDNQGGSGGWTGSRLEAAAEH